MAEAIRVNRLSQPVALASGAILVMVLWGVAFGESPFLTGAAGLIIVLAVRLLWRPGQPPTLLFLSMIHLLQVTTALFYADFLGIHINTLSEYGVDLESATWFALGAVLCLILGISAGNAGPVVWPSADAHAEARSWSPRAAFRFCTITLGLGFFFTELSTLSEGIRQFFLACASIQWIGFYVLGYVTLSERRGFGYFLVAVGVEVVVGFTGYFGEFREVFFVILVSFASVRPKLNALSITAITATGLVLLVLGAFWSANKTDYREFLNKGTDSQQVLVPLEDRFSFLAERVNNADMNTLATGFDLLLRRIAYVEFFGATLNFVPSARSHENGKMTMAAISHVLLPRFIVSDKAPLPNDTAVTLAYTGLPLPVSGGVSISIGYPGELYIDFGIIGMLTGMGILGFLYGKANRYIQRYFNSALMAYGATIALFAPGVYFETSLPKTIGGVATSFIVLLLVSKLVLPFAENALHWQEPRSIRHLKPT